MAFRKKIGMKLKSVRWQKGCHRPWVASVKWPWPRLCAQNSVFHQQVQLPGNCLVKDHPVHITKVWQETSQTPMDLNSAIATSKSISYISDAFAASSFGIISMFPWDPGTTPGITISPSAPVLGAATAASPKCLVPWQRGADAQTGAPARRKFQQKCQKG